MNDSLLKRFYHLGTLQYKDSIFTLEFTVFKTSRFKLLRPDSQPENVLCQ